MKGMRRKLTAALAFAIFIASLILVMLPVEVAFKQLALVEEKTIISLSGLEVTTNDILVIFSLAAGSVALATFFTEVILLQSEKIRRKR